MVYLVRHAHAGSQKYWPGPDHDRPLSAQGDRQAIGLLARLGGYPVARILSSPTVRCRRTVEPLGEQRVRPVELVDALDVDAPVEGRDGRRPPPGEGIDLAAGLRRRDPAGGPLPAAAPAHPALRRAERDAGSGTTRPLDAVIDDHDCPVTAVTGFGPGDAARALAHRRLLSAAGAGPLMGRVLHEVVR